MATRLVATAPQKRRRSRVDGSDIVRARDGQTRLASYPAWYCDRHEHFVHSAGIRQTLTNRITMAEALASLVVPSPFVDVTLVVNRQEHCLHLAAGVTLLDALREHLGLTGTKPACDQGACGACTVHLDGKRILSCLALAAQCDQRDVTTIEGLAHDSRLHAMQAAFVRHDALQCGFCTPGQIMSAIALIQESRAGSREEIREFMSGNLCRCGAYPNIVDAIADVAGEGRI